MQNQWPIVPLGDVDERMENLLVDIKTVSLVKGIRQLENFNWFKTNVPGNRNPSIHLKSKSID